MTQREWGFLLLRLGLATLFLWFGFSQLIDSVNWVSWVPEWAVNLLHIPPAMIVLANGILEVVGGALLALGIWVRPVAIILGLHLIGITIEVGLNAVGLRDFAITAATFALALLWAEERSPDA